MCESCQKFAVSGRKVRRCAASSSNSAASRARVTHNRDYRRNLSVHAAKLCGAEIGAQVMRANFTDIPAIVDSLGIDPDALGEGMPGTANNLAGIGLSEQGEKVLSSIADAKAAAIRAQARRAAEEAAAQAAADQAAAEVREAEAARIAAEDQLLSDQAAAVGMSPQQLAAERLRLDSVAEDAETNYATEMERVNASRALAERSAARAYEKDKLTVAARYEAQLAELDNEAEALDAARQETLAEVSARRDALDNGIDPDAEPAPTEEESIVEAPAQPVYWRENLTIARGASEEIDSVLAAVEAEDYDRKKDGTLSVRGRKAMNADLAAASDVIRELDPAFRPNADALDRIEDPAERAAQEAALAAAHDDLGHRVYAVRDEHDGWDPEEVEALRPYLGVADDQKITTFDLLGNEVPARIDAARKSAVTNSPLMGENAADNPEAAVTAALAATNVDIDALEAARVRIGQTDPLTHRGRVEHDSYDREALESTKAYFELARGNETFDDDEHRHALSSVPAAYVAQMREYDADQNSEDRSIAGPVALAPRVYVAGGDGRLTTHFTEAAPEDRDAAMGDTESWYLPNYVPSSMTGGTGRNRHPERAHFTPTDVELGQIIDGAKSEVIEYLAEGDTLFDPNNVDALAYQDVSEQDLDDYKAAHAAYNVGVREEFSKRVDDALADRSTWPALVDFASSVDPEGDLGGIEDIEDLRQQMVVPEIEGQESLFEL